MSSITATRSDDAPPHCKIVVVGDGAVGKTTLLRMYAFGEAPEKYEKTVFDNYDAVVDVDGKPVRLELWDTAGQEEFDRIRCLSYQNVGIFLLCFSLADPDTLRNAEGHWLGEITSHAPRAKVILVGTKTDLRDSPATAEALSAKRMKPITTADGRAAQARTNAVEYLEVCSLKNQGVQDVFAAALRTFLQPRKKQRAKTCTIF